VQCIYLARQERQFLNMYLVLFVTLVSSINCYVVSGTDDTFAISMDDSPVKVELFYESLCPGCRHFITTMLYPTFDKLRDTGVMEVVMYPYGNAKQAQNPDGSWNFTCQHDVPECNGNLLEVCIMKYLDWDSVKYLPVVECMEAAADPISSAQGCVKKHSNLSFDQIQTCAKGPEGNKLEHQMGEKTDNLDPSHTYVPWVVVNDQHTNALQSAAMTDLLALVCKLYQGTKPAECTEQWA